jgi:MFS family permease
LKWQNAIRVKETQQRGAAPVTIKRDFSRAGRGRQAPRLGVAALALATLLAALGTSIANVALPAMASGFEAPLAHLQWVILGYLLAVTCGVVGAGRLGDAIGRRRLLLGGLTLFMLASLLCAASLTLWLLIAGRVAQGIGAAAMIALPMAMAGDAAPRGRTGRSMGLLGATSAAGTALGPALGGALIALSGWRALFLLCAAGSAAALLLAWRYLLEEDGRSAARVDFDRTGTLLIARSLAGSLVAALLVSAVIMTTLVVGPFYLAHGLEQEIARVGLIMSAGPAVVVLTGIPAGRLADRIGARPVLLAGLALMFGGCAGLWLLPPELGVTGYLAALILTTAGYSLFQTGNNSFVMARAPADGRGLVSGLLNLSRNLGLIAGASVMAATFAAGLGGAAPAQAAPVLVAAAMRTTFGAAAMLILLAFAIGLARERLPRRTRAGA